MKSSYFRFFICNALLGLALFYCLKSHAQSTITFSKPRNAMYYTHNGSIWNHINNIVYTYNSAGLETEAIATHPITNQNQYKKTRTYNSFGYLTDYKQYNWQNSTWEIMISYRNTVTYTAGNKIAQVINSDEGSNNTWTNNFRYDYIYDSNQNLLEQNFFTWDISATAWIPMNRKVFTYNTNGMITQKQDFNFVNNAWNLIDTFTYSAWHVQNILPSSYTSPFAGGQGTRRNTVTLNPNGGYNDLQDFTFGNGWTDESRTTELRDIHGNVSIKKYETFNLSSNTWTVVSEIQNLRTYNSQSDITELIIRQGGTNFQIPGPAIDREKFVYSNFQYFTRTLGTSENQKNELVLNVFPNPAFDKIQLEFNDKKNQLLTATISDITGKTWQTKTFKPSEVNLLNLETLPKGIYLLQLQTETGSTVKRIVKQ